MKHALRREQARVRVQGRRSYRSLGSSLGLQETRIDSLIDEIKSGLPFAMLEAFSLESGIPIVEIASLLALPERTFARRRVSGRLSSAESERLLRVSSIFERAVRLFEGDVQAAVTWLKRPKQALGNRSPWTYLQTEIGAREVEDVIGQLEHGVFA
jgi:putative toxin-antitoxin system antitoxin component (TIGR02293 family)